MATVYIGGPMRGYKDLNFPAFHKAEAFLRNTHWEVVNPAKLNPDPNADYIDCMRIDIKALCDCDAIYLLNGWEKSTGANAEYQVARMLELAILFENNYNKDERKND